MMCLVRSNCIRRNLNVAEDWWEFASSVLVVDHRSCEDVIMIRGAARYATRHRAIMQHIDRGGVLGRRHIV
jgi:hypothetical protein